MINYIESDEIFRGNYYIEHFNECFDLLNISGRINYIQTLAPVRVENTGLFATLLNKKIKVIEPVYRESKDDIINEFDEKIDEFIKRDFEPVKDKPDKNMTRSFEQMWYFAQFVRYAEKTVFYNNDTDKPLFVDSALDEDHERIFVIKKDEYELRFKLQWIYDSTLKQMIKVVNIKVSRSYGKEMTNEYVIVDGKLKLNDVSDFLLMNMINDILFDCTLDTYKQVMNALFTHFEERMMFPCPSS